MHDHHCIDHSHSAREPHNAIDELVVGYNTITIIQHTEQSFYLMTFQTDDIQPVLNIRMLQHRMQFITCHLTVSIRVRLCQEDLELRNMPILLIHLPHHHEFFCLCLSLSSSSARRLL